MTKKKVKIVEETDEESEIEDDVEDIQLKNEDETKNEESEEEDEEIKDEEIKDEEIKDEETKDEESEDEYKCMYKFTKKKKTDVDVLDYEQELKFDDDENIHSDIIEPEQRKTKKKLFHYEFVKILSTRAKQLSLGAKPLIKNVSGLDPREIAKLEIKNGILPYIIERTLPNGAKERWKINELI